MIIESAVYFAEVQFFFRFCPVLKATYIQSIVAMVPHVLNDVHHFYMFEKPELNVVDLGEFLHTVDDGIGEDNNNK